MLFKPLPLLPLLLALAAAAPSPATAGRECQPGQYRCDYISSNIEVCDVHGWHTAASCKGQTCRYNGGSEAPYCHDQ
ncbi:hypothetical protein BU26DRAFT_514001 [Trematosphaeria pertusa]|uniref:Carbohydrate-binding module family 52 protein n=1 Tax=Trematosphaeria pertusa TaxID=390896 RepID=A0A6A6J5X9_9PLEO|nr:uncharacterized protein BU26DRAFT_514001 [Trematosphaeria pertusa]KAF2257300.1 hypothetical protein BU26DRAFT_514001 [Trematosphaeria pertusa]